MSATRSCCSLSISGVMPSLLKDRLDHEFIGQVRDGFEQIALTLLGRQPVHDLLDQWTDDSFLFIERHAQFRREEGEQQFLVVIVIDNGRCQAALISTVRTARHVRYAAEQSLLGLRILCDVKELFDIRRDHLTTAGTCNLCLRH